MTSLINSIKKVCQFSTIFCRKQKYRNSFNSFCETDITTIPKLDKDITRKKNYLFSCKNFKQNFSKSNAK